MKRLAWWAEWLTCRTVGCGSLFAYYGAEWPHRLVCSPLADNRPTSRP